VEVGLHTLFVGEIKDIKTDESMLNEDGVPGIERVSPILFAPEIRSYHSIGKTLGKAFSIGKEIQQK
ncbi:MAG: flavin reductase family protein, partial [Deltaproteobacteria bacterium]|nr:flavin reductase family protein [Deltaproteobacteria bacterium]